MNVTLPDVGERHMLRVKNGVLLVYKNTLSDSADISVTCPKNALFAILTNNQETVAKAVQIEGRAELLLSHGLALWDVLASCTITGAADSTIRDPIPNDIPGLLRQYPGITRIATTGSTAARLYRRLVEPQAGLPAIGLPSPSAANARTSFPQLVAAYRAALL